MNRFWQISLFLGAAIFLTLVLAGCTTNSTTTGSLSTPTSQPTLTSPSISPIAVTTSSVTATAPPKLQYYPLNCSYTATLVDTVSGDYKWALGNYPVWALGFTDPKVTLVFNDKAKYTEHGWDHKVLWVVDANYTRSVTLRGGSLEDNTPLWFHIGGFSTSTSPILDPKKA